MEYPKEIMKVSELIKMGYPEEWLMEIYRSRNQKIAWKAGTALNSPIVFDTAELEKYRRAQCTGV